MVALQTKTGEGTRLAYTGTNVGAITYTLPSGATVRGGNNPHNRYAWVANPQDVEHLLRLNKWELAPNELLAPNEPSDLTEQPTLIVELAESEPTKAEPEPKRRTQRRED